MKVILALDAGTTNVKAILVDQEANVLARSSIPLSIQFPKSIPQTSCWVTPSWPRVTGFLSAAFWAILMQPYSGTGCSSGVKSRPPTAPVHR